MNHIYVTPDDRLQKIFDEASPGSVIHLSPGVYRQKAVIRTPDLTILGSGREKTRIVYDDYARKRDPEGFEYITFRTYSLAVCADGVTMRDLAILNDAGNPARKGQQVALSVVADRFAMEDCLLSSTQDTLFLGPLPPDLIERYDGFLDPLLRRGGDMSQRFTGCDIQGTVDFIFGCGSTLFDGCRIHSRVEERPIGYVAAPAHSPGQTEGFTFRRCDFTCDDGVGENSIYLARPWRDFGLAVFENCEYGRHIHPGGFDPWSGTKRDRTARFFESPAVAGRVDWINQRGSDRTGFPEPTAPENET